MITRYNIEVKAIATAPDGHFVSFEAHHAEMRRMHIEHREELRMLERHHRERTAMLETRLQALTESLAVLVRTQAPAPIHIERMHCPRSPACGHRGALTIDDPDNIATCPFCAMRVVVSA